MDKFDYEKNLQLCNYYKKRVDLLATIRFLVFLMMIISFVVASSINYFIYIGFVFLVFFIILIFIHDRYYKKLDYYKKILVIIDEYKKRINGNWREFNDKGFEYENDLLNDLDIVGDNSLFQYLSVCNTLDGRDKLIDKLSNKKINNKVLLKRQEAILELSNKKDFVLNFQVGMYNYRDKKVRFSDCFKVLDKDNYNKKFDFFIAITFSFLSLILLFLALFKAISFNYFYGMFIFNFFVNFMYAYIFRDDFEDISIVSDMYSGLNKTYDFILKEDFSCNLLCNYFDKINRSFNSVKKLVFINDLNNLRNNILASFIFNGLLCVNMFTVYKFLGFKKNNIKSLKEGIDVILELESLISLSGLGYIRNDTIIPSFDDSVSIRFREIKHPLLLESKCVGNDFDSGCGVNIITGSNMGGKTSFLRTIGINLILMNAGTFVCAKEFSSSYFKIFSSMRVNDDIDKGISTFYAELLRVKEAIECSSDNRLVLIDEIFKGTNYNDRIYGAKSVINKLNDMRTIAFITTHDFELCELSNKNINNYFVKEYYEGNNIRFDYKIRKGRCSSTNAKYLMKKLGIID